MNTICTHCHKWFEVSDKALGKNARCRSCGKVFVIAPAAAPEDHADLAEVHPPGGSTAHLTAVNRDEVYGGGDPLSALADAAEASGYERMAAVSEHAREHGSSQSRRERGTVRGTATGATAAVTCGSIGIVIAVALLVVAILAAVKVVPLSAGLMAGLFIAGIVGSVIGFVGVVQGTGVRKRIRRAKGTLHGAGQGTTGILLGWLSLAVLLAACVTLVIVASKSGGIVVEQRTIQE